MVQELIQLNNINGCVYKAYDDVKICAEDADVIVTVTNSDKPFLELNYLKPNVHVNGKFYNLYCMRKWTSINLLEIYINIAVGVGNRHFAELESAVYEAGDVYSDYLAGSKQELDRLENFVIEFKGEIGELITGSLPMPISDRITIFQSSGKLNPFVQNTFFQRGCKPVSVLYDFDDQISDFFRRFLVD